MKIRHKITLWVTAAGLLTSMLFSLVVFLEMKEQPYHLLDSELEGAANAIAGQLAGGMRPEGEAAQEETLPVAFSRYWFRVRDERRKIIYESNLSRSVDIPLRGTGDDGYTITVPVSEKGSAGAGKRPRDVTFRVRQIRSFFGGVPYEIQIARPIDKLEQELSDVVVALAAGLLISTGLLIVLSYLVAGRIVGPIGAVNRLSREINDKTLGKRIPLGKSRDELYELSESLNRMFDRLQYSFDKQKHFIASASHDLKSPIAMLRLFFDEAAQLQDLPESFKQPLLDQGNNVLRMERLVRSLLEISILELKGAVDLGEFDLAALIRSVMENFSIFCAARRITVTASIPESLPYLGDEDRMRRAVVNLVDNAVKYNSVEGQIRLDVEVSRDFILLTLFNTGPGIPEEDLESIFDPFYRVEKSRSQAYGGSGLGLTIVREIVKIHGGRVTMESEVGAWARIRVTLPRNPRHPGDLGRKTGSAGYKQTPEP